MKDWRRVAMRLDRRADIFLSACALAAIVLFWLSVINLRDPGIPALLPNLLNRHPQTL